MEPDIIRRREGIQLSYNFPYLLNDVRVYPQKSDNGSTVIICAHDEGLRFMWYKPQKLRQAIQSRVSDNDVDLIWRDDTTASRQEEEQGGPEATQQSHTIAKDVEIGLGAAALRLAVPPLPLDLGDEWPSLLHSHAIVLVACADLSLRLIVVPLSVDRDQKSEIQQLYFTGPNSHQDLVSDVAITIVPAPLHSDDIRQGGGQSRSRGEEMEEARLGANDWAILLASTSPTGTGLLLIHQIPIHDNGQISTSSEDLAPFQRRFMRCSLAHCRISFNPSLYPSHRFANLLVAPSDGSPVKIYQAIPPASPGKAHRGSTATIDSSTSSSQAIRRSTISDKVLINLHTPFKRATDQDFIPKRKRVLDATWISHGRAVLVLLEDGEWGIWDVEATGPAASTSSSNLVRGRENVSGVQGGSLTKFAIRGSVTPRSAANKSTSGSSYNTLESSLAPMTPHTRKTRSDGFFNGPEQSVVENITHLSQPSRGCLAAAVQSNDASAMTGTTHKLRSQDECVLLSYGSTGVLVPSIQSYWRSGKSENGMFEDAAGSRAIALPQLQLAGEIPRNVQILPRRTSANQDAVVVTSKFSQDFLLATSSRLVIFTQTVADQCSAGEVPPLPMRPLTNASLNQDQVLLNSGQLDIDGMDRILNNMATSNTLSGPMAASSFNSFDNKKSVAFHTANEDEDEDENMAIDTPTVPKSGRSQLVVDKGWPNQGGARRLFT